MAIRFSRTTLVFLVCASFLIAGQARAEVIEEIVAWVGGEIITKSELDSSEEGLIADLYRRFTGEELEQRVKEAKAGLLQQMIDQKILYLRAARLFDLESMEDAFLSHVMEQQKLDSEEELVRLLTQEGMNLDQFKKRLVESFAPEEILRVEVGNRISVGDAEVEEYYNEHIDGFEIEAQITFREIVLLAPEGSDRAQIREGAEEIRLKALVPEADFDALAKEHSEAGTREQGGLLGPLKKNDISPALAEAAFAVREGGISEVLDMSYGFHIVMVESKTDAHLQTLDEVREDLRNLLESQQYFTDMQEFMKRARSEIDWRVNPKYSSRITMTED